MADTLALDSAALARAREDDRVVRELYDRAPYPSGMQRHSHPDHLATLAWLHGLQPAPPERCSVLELGCADGSNLLPMALELPESRYVGIDLSPRQIADGRAMAAELGVANLDLRAASILDLDASLGRFDYVICHGVFSWVTRPVQEKILALCRELLAENGVAYVSYNTHPGWSRREVVRDMLLWHVRGIDDPLEKVERSFALVDFLARAAADGQDAHSAFLRTTAERFAEYRDRPGYILHEYLEPTNEPLWFHDFAERAGRHGLQVLTDAEPHRAELDSLPPPVAAGIAERSADPIGRQQSMDFVVNRTFRKTLLCHREHTPERSASPNVTRRLAAASGTKPEAGQPDLRPGTGGQFRTERGASFSTSHPLAKAVLVALAAIWPRSAPFGDLLADVQERLGVVGQPADEAGLADLLGSFFWSGVVELHVHPPLCVETPGLRPRAAELARRQAAAGLVVTSQRRRVLKLDDPIVQLLLLHLDGSRDREALIRLLAAEVREGRLDVALDGAIVEDAERLPTVLGTILDHQLRKMAELGLLVE
jgi:SAM-dependent methyltransferase/methyltransferase-like protein